MAVSVLELKFKKAQIIVMHWCVASSAPLFIVHEISLKYTVVAV